MKNSFKKALVAVLIIVCGVAVPVFAGDYLGNIGYQWGTNGKKWDALGDLCVDYNYTRSANGTGSSYSYIGVNGLTMNGNNTEAEYFILEDWFGKNQQDANNLGGGCQTHSNITVDGKTYQVVTCIRVTSGCVTCNGQVRQVGQVFSIRQGMRSGDFKTCGTISIKKHFEEWMKIPEAAKYIYDKTYESKFLVEVGGAPGTSCTGWFEASYMKFSRIGACGSTSDPCSQTAKLSTTASGVQSWNSNIAPTVLGGTGDDTYEVQTFASLDVGGKLTWFGPNQGGGYAFRAEWINGTVPYIDENGTTQTATNVTAISSNVTTLSTGWYLMRGTFTNSGTITVSGDVHLILEDGSNVTVNGSSNNAGINVSAGNSLSIYAQSADASIMGKLTATGGNGSGGAGIGSGPQASGGIINISGGTVTATGGGDGAGIGSGGGGYGSDCGTINISGGTVTATSGYGAGIGGGNGSGGTGVEGSGGTINISGGTVTATSGYGGAGIGGGYKSYGGTITISGGTVTATGGTGGAGIGNGMGSFPGAIYRNSITISGGIVTATGGMAGESTYGGAGIGTGGIINYCPDGSKITINGGTIIATGGSGLYYSRNDYGIGIGGYRDCGSIINIGGGTVIATGGSNGIGYFGEGIGDRKGIFTLDGDAVVFASGIGTTDANQKLTSGILFIADRNTYIEGASVVEYFPTESITAIWAKQGNKNGIAYAGSKEGFIEIPSISLIDRKSIDNVPYIDENGISQTANNVIVINAENIASIDNLYGWFLVRGDLNRNATLRVSGVAHIILENGSNLTVNGNFKDDLSVSGKDAGINVSKGNSLSIYAQSTDANIMGNLTATGSYGAGIGGIGDGDVNGKSGDGGTINISGGTVTAIGGSLGAGIGGGDDGKGGIINISGGIVTAIGTNGGAGIGGGIIGDGGTITISGGKVTAIGSIGSGGPYGRNSASIGGGSAPQSTSGGSGGTITISGGTVMTFDGDRFNRWPIMTFDSSYYRCNGSIGSGEGYGKSDNGTFTLDGNAVVFASNIGDTDESRRKSGILFAGNCETIGTFYGTSVTLKENVTIPSSNKLTIPENATLTIPTGITLNNKGTITPANGSTINITGTVNGNKIIGANVNAPTTKEITSTSIKINAAEFLATTGQMAEYAITTTNTVPTNGWQIETTFAGLTENTTYWIFARSKENSNFAAGTVSAGLQVSTEASTPTFPNRENPIIGRIGVQTTTNAIFLSNLPQKAKIEVYNLQGKRIYTTTSHSPLATSHLKIEVQTKGIYIIKIGTQTMRVAVR